MRTLKRSMPRTLAALALLLSLGLSSAALAELPYRHMPPSAVEPGLPLVVDVDSVGSQVRDLRVYYRDAAGRFGSVLMTRVGAGFTAFVPVPAGAEKAEYYLEAEGPGGPWRMGSASAPLAVRVGAPERPPSAVGGGGRFRFGPELNAPALIAGGSAFLLGLGAVATGVVGSTAARDARDRYAREGVIDQPLVDSARSFGRVTTVLASLAAVSAAAGTTFFLFPDLLTGGDGYSGGFVLRMSFDDVGLMRALR